jgi:hypothetical protein
MALEPDGAVLDETPVTMTVDPAAAAGVRAVALTLQAAEGATRAVRWRIAREGRPVAAGRLGPGQSRDVRVPVPTCPNGDDCPPVSWTLRVSGPPVGIPLPAFGPPGPARPVMLMVTAARIGA